MRARWSAIVPILCACGGSALPVRVEPPHAEPAVPEVTLPRAASPPSPNTRPEASRRSPPPPTAETSRLARLAKLWGRVRYLHPYLYEREIDWDAAFVRAVADVMRAESEENEAAAVVRMLGALGDRLTRVEDASDTSKDLAGGSSFRTEGGVTVVTLAPRTGDEAWGTLHALGDAVSRASMLVIDVRPSRDPAAVDRARVALSQLEASLVSHEAMAAPLRVVEHRGYAAQGQFRVDSYFTRAVEKMPRVFRPTAGAHPVRVAFIVNGAVGVPAVVTAMQKARDAVVVADGDGVDPASEYSEEVPFGRRRVLVREAETAEPWRADAYVKDGGQAVGIALKLLHEPRKGGGRTGAFPPPREMRWTKDNVYADEAYPPIEHRLLALVRFWEVIDLFYPYKALLDDHWDDVLEEFIPRFIAVTTAADYELLVRQLAARVEDSHVVVQGGKAFGSLLGDGVLPISVTRVEGKPVVTFVGDDTAKRAGIGVGDILVDVEGESFDARAERLGLYLAGSNVASHARRADQHALFCRAGRMVPLQVVGNDGNIRSVVLACGRWYPEARSGPVFRKITSEIGYVDLDRLEPSEVSAMFDALEGTRAIVFDMRGYPHGTVISICPRLDSHAGPTVRGLTATPLVAPGPADEIDRRELNADLVPPLPPGARRYRGKTVMLIDSRTMSQAETTALCFEAANGTKFIGSPSAGADGEITSTCLPGNLCVQFTGAEVRHADGRPMQRSGIQPDVLVVPTVRGVREGRDEVLEAAVNYLQTER